MMLTKENLQKEVGQPHPSTEHLQKHFHWKIRLSQRTAYNILLKHQHSWSHYSITYKCLKIFASAKMGDCIRTKSVRGENRLWFYLVSNEFWYMAWDGWPGHWPVATSKEAVVSVSPCISKVGWGKKHANHSKQCRGRCWQCSSKEGDNPRKTPRIQQTHCLRQRLTEKVTLLLLCETLTAICQHWFAKLNVGCYGCCWKCVSGARVNGSLKMNYGREFDEGTIENCVVGVPNIREW